MDDLDPIINQASQRFGVSPDLIRRVIKVESSGNPRAVSPKGAQGLMQLMPATGKARGVTDPFNPLQNIMGGTQELASLTKKYHGDIRKALAAWNMGQGNLDKGMPQPPETQQFVGKVLGQGQMGQHQGMEQQGMGGVTPEQSDMADFLATDPEMKAHYFNSEQHRQESLEVYKQLNKEILEAEGEHEKAMKALPEIDARKFELPIYKPVPPISDKQYQDFTSQSLAFAALGLFGGTSGLYAATKTLDSAMKGWMDGNTEAHKQHMEDFKVQFDSAVKQQESYMNYQKALLERTNMKLKDQMDAIKLRAQIQGDKDMIQASGDRDWTAIHGQLQKQEQATKELKLKAAKLQEGIKHNRMTEQLKQQEITTKVNQLKELGVADKKVLNAASRAYIAFKSIRNDVAEAAKNGDNLLGSFFRSPFWDKPIQEIQSIIKSNPGALTNLLGQSDPDAPMDVQAKQEDIRRRLAMAIEQYAQSTGGPRAWSFIQFILANKPSMSDSPAFFLSQVDKYMHELQDDVRKTIHPLTVDEHKHPREQVEYFAKDVDIDVNTLYGTPATAPTTGQHKEGDTWEDKDYFYRFSGGKAQRRKKE